MHKAKVIVKKIATSPLKDLETLRDTCIEKLKFKGSFEDIVSLQTWKTIKVIVQKEITRRNKVIKQYSVKTL